MNTSVDAVLAEVEPIAARFADGGYALYLVGGIVRDIELGAELAQLDFDLTTDARPGVVKRLVGPIAEAVWDQGERFGTIGCLIDERPFEITTHRAESYSSGSRKPEVQFGDDIEFDLSRRDFTINAMAISVFDGQLIDPFDGRGALADKRLVTPVDPTVSFSDDPLRVLRAARFIARYDLVPSPELIEAATVLADRLSIVSVERIRDELDKLLVTPDPSAGLAFLAGVGALEIALPFLSADRVDRVGADLSTAAVDVNVRRLVLFASAVDSSAAGPDRTTLLSSLRYPNSDVRLLDRVLDGIETVVDHGLDDGWTEEEVRRLVLTVDADRVETLWAVVRSVDPAAAAPAEGAYRALSAVEDLSDLQPAASGADVMEALDLEPGVAVGRALAELTERRLRDGPASVAEELDHLRNHHAP